jgi:adenosine deaminase
VIDNSKGLGNSGIVTVTTAQVDRFLAQEKQQLQVCPASCVVFELLNPYTAAY